MIWIAGARVDTLAVGVALLAVGIARRRPLAALGCLAIWAFGFEASWRFVAELVYFDQVHVGWLLFVPLLIGAGWLVGLGPDWRWLVVAAAVTAGWAALGFQANWPYATAFPQGRHPFEWWLEIPNALYVATWGMAYLPAARPAPIAAAWRRSLALWSRGQITNPASSKSGCASESAA